MSQGGLREAIDPTVGGPLQRLPVLAQNRLLAFEKARLLDRQSSLSSNGGENVMLARRRCGSHLGHSRLGVRATFCEETHQETSSSA